MAKAKGPKKTGGKPEGPDRAGVITDALRKAIRAAGPGTAYYTAKTAGVSVDSVQRFLDGERDLRLETVDAIAEALGYRLVKLDD